MVANPNNNMLHQCILIEGLALNTFTSSSLSYVDEDNIINIQLPYDPNRPIELKLWDGNFHSVSLHRLLEYLASDAKNIKKSIVCMAIYIKNKKIETSKSKNIKNFKDISKAAWDLISSIYKARWDSLVTDNHKNSFRQKISYKFIPCINLEKHSKKQDITANKPASIEQLPPLISTKSLKEVNEISKFFKSKTFSTMLYQAKTYA